MIMGTVECCVEGTVGDLEVEGTCSFPTTGTIVGAKLIARDGACHGQELFQSFDG